MEWNGIKSILKIIIIWSDGFFLRLLMRCVSIDLTIVTASDRFVCVCVNKNIHHHHYRLVCASLILFYFLFWLALFNSMWDFFFTLHYATIWFELLRNYIFLSLDSTDFHLILLLGFKCCSFGYSCVHNTTTDWNYNVIITNPNRTDEQIKITTWKSNKWSFRFLASRIK